MMIKKKITSILPTLTILFMVSIFTFFTLLPSVVSAQDDTDLFEEMEEQVKEKKDEGSDDDLFGEMEENNGKIDAEISDDDLFEDLTEEKKGVKKSKQPKFKFVKNIWDNLEGSLRLRYHYFPYDLNKQEGRDNSKHVNEALLRFSTWTGKDNLNFYLSGWAEAGSQDDSYKGSIHWLQDPGYERRYFDINELYALYSGENSDTIVGKKEFTTGISTLFSPSDRFRPGDVHDPSDPKQFGIWQVRTKYFTDNYNFDFAVIPVYTEKKVPAPSSRWWGDTSSENDGGNLPGGGNNETATNDSPDISFEYIDYFAKVKTTHKGWDLFASMNSGPNPYSVEKKVGDEYIRKVIRIYSLAGGFSTTKGNFEIHGESLFNYSDRGRDDDYLSSVAGFTYTIDDYAKYLFMEKVIVTLEYAREAIFDSQSAADYTKSSKKGRAGTNDFLSRILFKYNEDIKFENLFHYAISELSWANRFNISYLIRSGLTCNLGIEVFEGDDDSGSSDNQNDFDSISYAQWDNNDRVIVSFKYEF
jgi:hypothetical protein